MGSTSTHTRTEYDNGKTTVTKTVTTVDDDGNESTQVFVSENGGDFNETDNSGGDSGAQNEEQSDDQPSQGNAGASGSNGGLQAHNNARAAQGVAALDWDEGLCRDAQNWADKIKNDPNWPHCPWEQRNGQGENLWQGSGYSPSSDFFKMATDSWVKEKKDYEAQERGEPHGVVGHCTQVMWRDTKKVGMAVADNGNRTYTVVARYYPTGNWDGQKPY